MDRTGTGCYSLFGGHRNSLAFDLSEGFPLVTTKEIHIPSVVHELLWFLSGSTNVKCLNDNGVRIWNEWADENGGIGPMYGEQWRGWPTWDNGRIDQIARVVYDIKNTPYSRRHLVSAWNVEYLPNAELSPKHNTSAGYMALAPCHVLFQFYVSRNKLSCQLYQRSADIFLGVPFNIASYSLLTHMIAQQCELEVGEFIWIPGDVHLYANHKQQAYEQLRRTPRPLPKLNILRKPNSIDEYKFEDFEFVGYTPHPKIKAEVAV